MNFGLTLVQILRTLVTCPHTLRIILKSRTAELPNQLEHCLLTYSAYLNLVILSQASFQTFENFLITVLKKVWNILRFTGPFLPCQDLFDWWTLRCGVWVVFLLAMLGNGTVVFVLIFSRSKMDVPRFLVCNLAAADFFMGIYLGSTTKKKYCKECKNIVLWRKIILYLKSLCIVSLHYAICVAYYFYAIFFFYSNL